MHSHCHRSTQYCPVLWAPLDPPAGFHLGKQWLHAIRLVLGHSVAINTVHCPRCGNYSAMLWFSCAYVSLQISSGKTISWWNERYELQHRSVWFFYFLHIMDDRIGESISYVFEFPTPHHVRRGSADCPNQVTLLEFWIWKACQPVKCNSTLCYTTTTVALNKIVSVSSLCDNMCVEIQLASDGILFFHKTPKMVSCSVKESLHCHCHHFNISKLR